LQNKKFKLIYDAGLEANNEFYDLSRDPYERNNLINNKAYSEKINKFTSIIKDFLKITGHRSKLREKIKELKKIGEI
jgi:hypothetical protein